MSKMEVIPAGSLLTITAGAYSDYQISGTFRALVDIDADKLRAEFLTERGGEDSAQADVFMGWIARKGLVEAVPCFEWFLCDYEGMRSMNVSNFSDVD